MANPSRGEVPLDIRFDKDRTDRFVLKFSNAGHRAMEDFLNMESPEIIARITTGRIGARMITGLFYGATRKFHREDFPFVSDVDDYMDEIDEEAEEDEGERAQGIFSALVAAYTKSNPSEIEAEFFGEDKRSSEKKASGRGSREPSEASSAEGAAGPKKGRSSARVKKTPEKSDSSGSGEDS